MRTLRTIWAGVVLWGGAALLIMAPAPRAIAQTPVASSPVTAEVRFFGAGGHVRPGEWAGVQVELTDAGSGQASRRVLVQIHQRDVDGDELLCQRETTLTVGVARSLWLYLWMPWSTSPTSDFTISVRALSERESAGQPEAGTQLLAKRVRPNHVNVNHEPMIGIVGRADAGLAQYRLEARSNMSVETWHERYDIVGGLEPRWLPDQWIGLAQFEAIVWTGGDPDDLTEGRDEALMEWVQRGGHLVIVPPVVGSNWFAVRNPLASILPAVDVLRLEGRSLEPYRNLLTVPEVGNDLPLPDNTVLYSFTPKNDAEANDAIKLMTGPDGCIAVRRVVGTGMVTVLGLDVRHRRLTATGLLAAESLWHPILGKRFDILTAEQQARHTGKLPSSGRLVDAFIGDKISKGAAAGVGVLLALVVFGAYWLLAGPGGFGLLKAKGWVRHAWVAFVATVATFAVIAWTGAKAISPTRYEGAHLTFVDQVYGEGLHRTRTYASCLLPIYGEATLVVGEPGLDEAFTQCIAPWAEQGTGSLLSFPDSRAYAWNIAQPQRITVPARSTIKQVRCEWMGGPRWGNIHPVSEADAPSATWPVSPGATPLRGRIMHGFDEPMSNVKIVYCAGLRSEDEQAVAKDNLRSVAYIWSPPIDPWAPGEENAIDLSQGYVTSSDARLDFNFRKSAPTSSLSGLPSDSRVNDRDAPQFLTWFSSIEPLDYQSDTNRARVARLVRREGHGLDLSKWLTMPCLIITGEVNIDRPQKLGSPTPMQYGSGGNPRALPTEGRTYVRWIYPLAARPLHFDGAKVEPLPEDRQKDEDTQRRNR